MFEEARITPKILSLKDDLVGDVQNGAVGADGDDRPGPADRLRQRREPAAGPSRVAAAGAGDSRGARRRHGPDRPRAAGRERDPRPARRRRRARPGVRRAAAAGGAGTGQPAADRRHRARLSGAARSRWCCRWLPGLLFGAIPVLKYAGVPLGLTLRGGGRTATASQERHRARNLLVVAQVALALVLLVSSGLMIRTFQALSDVHPGFVRAGEVQTLAAVDSRLAGQGGSGGRADAPGDPRQDGGGAWRLSRWRSPRPSR